MEESKLTIANPERVNRILHRICQAKLQVLIRCAVDDPVAIKGQADLISLSHERATIRFVNISENGSKRLLGKSLCQVEFVMMSAKVIFVSKILVREKNSILMQVPQVLTSIDRRKNVRFSTKENIQAFIKLSNWVPKIDDITSLPIFYQYKNLAGYIPIADISQGGVCGIMKFPAAARAITRGCVDKYAQLVLPMRDPFEIGIDVRWTKKISEQINESGAIKNIRSFRFGMQFLTVSEEVNLHIHQFMQQLSQAEAI